jgi:HEAT repeat protein
MKLIKIISLVAWFSLMAIPSWAAEERISTLLRSLLAGGTVPSENVFYDAINEDYVRGLSADGVRDFLPLARTVLRDSRPEARRYGLMCFFAVTLRFSDSEPLLEPYIPDLLRIADDHANSLRLMALSILCNTVPRVSQRTLAYLAAHLADKENSAAETGTMAWTLLQAGSDRLTKDVIAFVRKQNNREVTEATLRYFHVHPTKNSDALAFIGDSLDSTDLWIRRRAVEAVADVPMVERSPFLAQLSRLSADPSEPHEIRSMAAEALKK